MTASPMNFSTVPPSGDDLARRVEIVREELPHLLGVTGLGERREAD